MGQSDNSFDIDIYKTGKGWRVIVSYWYHEKKTKEGKQPKVTSCTTYTWYTECRELIEWFQRRKTKIFYSQLRVLCRQFGTRERITYYKEEVKVL